MTIDTLTKRLYSQLDYGMTGYPDASIDTEDRAYLSNVWYFYTTPDWQQSYLGRINYNLVKEFATIGDTNQEDLSKATFPLYNIYLLPDETISQPNLHIDNISYRFKTNWEIHCFNKTTEQADSRFAQEDILFDLLYDVKQLLGTKILLDICEKVVYDGCRVEKLNIGGDIIIPQKLIIKLSLTYSQQRDDPSKGLTC